MYPVNEKRKNYVALCVCVPALPASIPGLCVFHLGDAHFLWAPGISRWGGGESFLGKKTTYSQEPNLTNEGFQPTHIPELCVFILGTYNFFKSCGIQRGFRDKNSLHLANLHLASQTWQTKEFIPTHERFLWKSILLQPYLLCSAHLHSGIMFSKWVA